MRKGAQVPQPTTEVVRLMIHDDSASGVYLFGFASLQDGENLWDEWYETVADAESMVQQKYSVAPSDWYPLPDVVEHCQQNWIAPVRIKGQAEGNPQWGSREKLVDGRWVDFRPE
ncbi:hypothetical protein [Hymenobacter cellulosivorans]|uniref:Uncharacterized protein n=1 Tax=Hymenobacter cellulosivorans TaxID=2932249 RepID=A0ABY4FI02_9BACT|nr:hypothetical protein [Hymenobacter cellulosivorans]UOQ54086.1 hypothetical protein MUN80_04815 [Hymenobacter cellulosivorans]